MTITPEQFNQLATKENLKELKMKLEKELASKKDLKGLETKMGLDMKGLEERLEDKLASKEDMNKVLNSVDGLANRFSVIEDEFKMDKIAHDRIEKDVDQIKSHLDLKTAP